MELIVNQYKKNLVRRYNKEVGVPYYSFNDFKGLKQEANAFTNSKGVNIHYYFYYYENFKKEPLIFFCPGIGPGHTAYLREIETLAKHGYKVLTIDYTGCGESDGEIMGSLNMPTLDCVELLNLLNLKEQIIVIGHSLGGYTALNLINLRGDIKKAIIMSGFISIRSLIKEYVRSNFVTNRILKYEEKTVPEYYSLNNIDYIKNTNDKIFVIQSEDDTMVPYKIALKVYEDFKNHAIKTLKLNGRKHNPNYTKEAVDYMTEAFANLAKLIKNKTIKTDEDRINYFKNISIDRLTEQDATVFNDIFAFIEK